MRSEKGLLLTFRQGFPVRDVGFFPNDRFLFACGVRSRGLRDLAGLGVWDLSSNELLFSCKFPAASLTACVTTDGKELIVGTNRALMSLDAKNGRQREIFFENSTSSLISWSISPDGEWFAFSFEDKTFALMNKQRLQIVVSKKMPCTDATVSFSSNSKLLAIQHDAGNHSTHDNVIVRLFQVPTMDPFAVIRKAEDVPIGDSQFLPGGKQLALFCQDSRMRIYDLVSCKVTGSVSLPKGAYFFRPAFSSDGRSLAMGGMSMQKRKTKRAGSKGTLIIMDWHSGAILSQIAAHSTIVSGIAFSHGARLLASGGDGTIKVWDVNQLVASQRN